MAWGTIAPGAQGAPLGPISTTTTSMASEKGGPAQPPAGSPPTTVPEGVPPVDVKPVPNHSGPEPGIPAAVPHIPLNSAEAPGIAAFGYQSDTMWFDQGSGNGIYNVDVNVFIYERNRCDSDTCTNGQRLSNGFVWFVALASYFGDPQGDCKGYLHGGLGLGNGVSSGWFLDWSGYDNVPTCANGTSLGPGKPRNPITQLQDDRWYKLRMWRQSWNGTTGCWGFWAIETAPNPDIEHYAGSWCEPGFYQLIADQHQFVEIAETNPCTTDVWGVHAQAPQYRDLTAGVKSYPDGYVIYEANCTNTYDRSINDAIPYWIDDREATRSNDPDGDLFNWEW